MKDPPVWVSKFTPIFKYFYFIRIQNLYWILLIEDSLRFVTAASCYPFVKMARNSLFVGIIYYIMKCKKNSAETSKKYFHEKKKCNLHFVMQFMYFKTEKNKMYLYLQRLNSIISKGSFKPNRQVLFNFFFQSINFLFCFSPERTDRKKCMFFWELLFFMW